MNAKEHAEKLAAARAELARIEAIVPEKEKPGMVLPEQKGMFARTWLFKELTVGFGCGHQADSYQDAFLTMLLMRAQKGIVNAQDSSAPVGIRFYRPIVNTGEVKIESYRLFIESACMFPCFASEADARAAIAAVGEDRIIRCAKWLAGCV